MRIVVSRKHTGDFLFNSLGLFTLFMMTVTYHGFTMLKTCSLLSVAGIALIKKHFLKRKYLLYVIIFSSYYMLSLLLGIMNGYAFNVRVDYVLFQYYVAVPFITIFIASYMGSHTEYFFVVYKVLKFLTSFIVFMDLWKIAAIRGILPDIDYFNLILVSSNRSFIEELTLRIMNETSLMFLMPFFITDYFIDINGKHKSLDTYTLLFGFIYVLLSGRRLLEIVVFGTFIPMFMYTTIKKKQYINIFISLMMCLLIFFIVGVFAKKIGVENIFQRITNTFLSGMNMSSSGTQKRVSNATALLELWFDSPIWGNGLNAYAANSLASSSTKWSYEVFYNALLAQVGLFGFLIFTVGIFHITKTLCIKYKCTQNKCYLAILVGFISFILCGASNPLVYVPWPWIIALSFSAMSIENVDITSYYCSHISNFQKGSVKYDAK